MALGVSQKVSWSDILDAPLVYVAGRDVALRDQLAEPCGRAGIDLVVVGAHAPALSGIQYSA